MSYPLGWRSAGNSLENNSISSGQPAWTAHVIEESIQVSITSVSPLNLLPPHFGHLSIFGGSVLGSIGSQSSSATIVWPQFSQYQTGMGVANILCLDITQSQSNDLTQSIRRFLAHSGTHFIFSAHSKTLSAIALVLTNHCILTKISIGVWHLQQVPIFWIISSSFKMKPIVFKSLTIRFLHSVIVNPSYFPAAEVILPCSFIALIIGKLYFFCHFTSILSPNVHIITTPVPNLGSTSGSL